MSFQLVDKHDDGAGNPRRWTFGSSSGPGSRFGGAHLDGTVGLHDYTPGAVRYRIVKCRSYRRAVRVLRWHLMGYKV